MQNMPFLGLCILTLVLGISFVPLQTLHAEETYTMGTVMTTATFRFNNENWFTAPHPKVISFTMHDDGSAYGVTESGVPFSQYNVPNAYGIRVQRFEMQDHYHYIIDGEVAYTTAELSARLTKAYAERIAS